VVGVALVPEAAGYDKVVNDALELEATFGQVATGLEFRVLAAHLCTFPSALPF
jgi:hypothetical protein